MQLKKCGGASTSSHSGLRVRRVRKSGTDTAVANTSVMSVKIQDLRKHRISLWQKATKHSESDRDTWRKKVGLSFASLNSHEVPLLRVSKSFGSNKKNARQNTRTQIFLLSVLFAPYHSNFQIGSRGRKLVGERMNLGDQHATKLIPCKHHIVLENHCWG